MLNLLTLLWIAFQVVIGYNLIFPLILSVISLLSKKRRSPETVFSQPDYAVIITAYQYTDSLPNTVSSVLQSNYKNYLIYVVADNCDTSNLHFDDERVILLKPEEVLKSNTKSHFYAIERFRREHQMVTIIDSDNLVHSEYFNELNKCFDQGFEAVQGTREAKNLDTTYACLDAARDIYYHHYDCKLLFNCGSSATLSGSGMAFTTELYRDCLEKENISGAGFDKILQARIVEKDKRIAFEPSAIVFDEKTSRPDQLVNQRSRWINTWFKYFRLGFGIIMAGVKNLSTNQFLFGMVLMRPPLFLFLIVSVLIMVINFFVYPAAGFIWLAALIVFTACFFKALIMSNTDPLIYKSLIGIPKFIFYQLISLTKIRRSDIRSVSTKHYHS